MTSVVGIEQQHNSGYSNSLSRRGPVDSRNVFNHDKNVDLALRVADSD